MSKAEEYSSSIIGELLSEITPEETEKTRKRMMLAARIDDGIKAKGWRKTDFAKALNKRPSEITKWLSGTHNFNTDTLFEIEAVLNISLMRLDDQPEEQVIKFHVVISKNIQTSKKEEFSKFPPVITFTDLYSGQKSVISGVSSKSSYLEYQS